jgi:hypothetical protein
MAFETVGNFIGAFVVLGIFVVLMRPTRRRLLASLEGSVVFLLLAAWDCVPDWQSLAWGRSVTHWGPLSGYLILPLKYGGFGLLGWRVRDRFGSQGLRIFLVCFALLAAADPRLPRHYPPFSLDIYPYSNIRNNLIIDFLSWFLLAALAMWIQFRLCRVQTPSSGAPSGSRASPPRDGIRPESFPP